MKPKIPLCLILFFALSLVCLATDPTSSQDARRANQQMRQDITWMVEGLAQLEHAKNPALHLTPEQARHILPIFQSLVEKHVILLKQGAHSGPNPAYPARYSSGAGQQPASGDRKSNAIAQIMELTKFGYAQSDQVDAILTPRQVSFIDNWNFNPAKYGYFGSGGSSGNHQSAGTGQSGQPTQQYDPKMLDEIRAKIQAGRELMIKLNNDVWGMLQAKAAL